MKKSLASPGWTPGCSSTKHETISLMVLNKRHLMLYKQNTHCGNRTAVQHVLVWLQLILQNYSSLCLVQRKLSKCIGAEDKFKTDAPTIL
jgi:hypothetical protein